MGGQPRLKIPTPQEGQTEEGAIFAPKWLPKLLRNNVCTSHAFFLVFDTVLDQNLAIFKPFQVLKMKHFNREGRHF